MYMILKLAPMFFQLAPMFYQLAYCLIDLETCKHPIRFLDSYMLYSSESSGGILNLEHLRLTNQIA